MSCSTPISKLVYSSGKKNEPNSTPKFTIREEVESRAQRLRKFMIDFKQQSANRSRNYESIKTDNLSKLESTFSSAYSACHKNHRSRLRDRLQQIVKKCRKVSSGVQDNQIQQDILALVLDRIRLNQSLSQIHSLIDRHRI